MLYSSFKIKDLRLHFQLQYKTHIFYKDSINERNKKENNHLKRKMSIRDLIESAK